MTSQYKQIDSIYDKFKRHFDLRKERYLKMIKEHNEAAAINNHNLSDDDPEDFQPPTQKEKVVNLDDPLEFLPTEVCDKILKFFTPKELLDAMEVSATWKSFIESRESRMRRAMSKIVVNFDLNEIDQQLEVKKMNRILASGRKYKHMRAAFGLQLAASKFPFIIHASTLETLEITYRALQFAEAPMAINFMKLSKLIIKFDTDGDNGSDASDDSLARFNHAPLMNFIKASKFPEVTHLKIFEFDTNATTFNQFIEKFPKLKVLQVTYDPEFLSDCWMSGHEEQYTKFESQPKIEAICVNMFFTNLLIGFEDTLTEVYVEHFNEQLAILLENFKKLQTLRIDFFDFDGNVDTFPQNESLQTLSILNMDYGGTLHQNHRNIFHDILGAFPALKTLNFNDEAYEDLILFLASNMMNLKKLACSHASDEALLLYMSLGANEHRFINTSFELAEETFGGLRSFYDIHFK